jgi:hypothetical protein
MSNEVTLENEIAAPVSAHRKLTTPEAAKNFMLAGKAIFTLVSMKTGTRYTYKVTHKAADAKWPEKWFVAYLNGPDNWTNYRNFGQIKKGNSGMFFSMTAKAVEAGLTPASLPVAGFEYAFRNINAGQEPKNLEVWHAGKCGRCGRLLTVPSSIEMGLGPECASKGF